MQRKQQRQPATDTDCLGLMANGSAGDWEVAIDETTEGPERWFMQLEGPSVYFSFEIPSTEIIATALDFLGGSSSLSVKDGSLVVGKHRQTPVVLIRDDEYKDRYFLMMGQEADVVVRLTIAGQDLKDIREALRHATEDIEEEG